MTYHTDVSRFTTFQYRLAVREASAGISQVADLRTLNDRIDQYRRLRSIVGNTPLLKTQDIGGTIILTKWEACNPSESHYDRAYLNVIQTLEEDGVIKPGDRLFEITSGSAGTSFSWLSSRLGYDTSVIVPPELPQGRIQEMINFGTDVRVSNSGYVPQAASELRAAIKAYSEAGYDIAKIKQNGYFVIKATKEGEQTVIFVNHSEHQLVVDSFRDIAREVARVLPADVVIDDVALILGNWTTTTAISTELRSIFPNIRVTGIEDATAPVYYEQLYGSAPELVNGQGLQMTFGASARKVYGDVRLKFDDVDLLDQIMLVNPITRDEVRDEVNNRTSHGLPINVAESIGNSSAAALSVARSLAETKPPRAEGQARVILILAYDHLDRYGEAVPFRELANHPYSLSEITAGTRIGVSNPHQRSMIPPGPSWRQAPVATLDALPTSIDLAYYGPVGRIMANASLS